MLWLSNGALWKKITTSNRFPLHVWKLLHVITAVKMYDSFVWCLDKRHTTENPRLTLLMDPACSACYSNLCLSKLRTKGINYNESWKIKNTFLIADFINFASSVHSLMSSIPMGAMCLNMKECFLHSLVPLLLPWVRRIYVDARIFLPLVICLLFPWVQCTYTCKNIFYTR